MKNNNLEPHELSKLFPPLNADGAAAMAADIKVNGLREPVITFEGKILDGVQRYGACREANVEPDLQPYEFTEAFHNGMHPVDFIMSLNLHRRHMTDSQKAVIKVAAEKLREQKFTTAAEVVHRGHKSYKDTVRQDEQRAVEFIASREKKGRGRYPLMSKSQRQMAEEVRVHSTVISKAARLARRSPQKFEEVRAGKATLDNALESLPPTARQKKAAKVRAEKLRAGLLLTDTLEKLRRKASRNNGQIYVELGGYGFRCFVLCRSKW